MSEDSANQIEVYDVITRRSEAILTDPGLGREVAWASPRRLIYSWMEAQPNQGDSNLWWVELDAHTGRLSGSPTRITSDRAAIASISVTSDGKRMALVRSASQADVYLSEVEARGKGLSTPRRFTRDDRQDFPSSWTPDGKALLIFSDRDGPFHIFKQNVDQTQPELLVGGKSDVWLPHMTPDGSGVLYLASPEPGEQGNNVRILRIPPSGGPSQLVLEGPAIVNFQCARLPSIVCIYGQSGSDYYRFFLFDSVGGRSAELSAAKVRKEDGLNSWNLSPDGKYLASCKSQNPYAATELRIFSLTDNSTRYIPVPNVRVIIGIDWAADSKSVFVGGYMRRGSWGTRSGLVNVDLAGNAKTLLEVQNPSVMGGTPSPDGHRLAVGANTNSSNAWLLENF
jgi:Tol biopolymer transport system component